MFLIEINRPYLARHFYRFPIIRCDYDEYLINLDITEDNWKAVEFVEICHRLDVNYYFIPDVIWDDFPEGLEYLCQLLANKSTKSLNSVIG